MKPKELFLEKTYQASLDAMAQELRDCWFCWEIWKKIPLLPIFNEDHFKELTRTPEKHVRNLILQAVKKLPQNQSPYSADVPFEIPTEQDLHKQFGEFPSFYQNHDITAEANLYQPFKGPQFLTFDATGFPSFDESGKQKIRNLCTLNEKVLDMEKLERFSELLEAWKKVWDLTGAIPFQNDKQANLRAACVYVLKSGDLIVNHRILSKKFSAAAVS
jgi:hypothetical protein